MKRTAALLLLLVALGACASNKVPEPQIVYVPVYEPPPALPLPDAPEAKTCDADPADWREYLRAMIEDLLAAWAHIAELRHIIDSYNDSRSE